MTTSPVEPRDLGRLAVSPLRLVLIQARTRPNLAFEQPAEVQRLVEMLEGRWSVSDRQANRELTVQIGPGGLQQQATVPETVWVLTAEDGQTSAAVSASSVAVETNRYERWDRFRAAAAELFGAVQRVVPSARCTRLGLRYVNELRDDRASGDPQRLAELVNSELIAPALALQRPLNGSLAEIRVLEEEDAVFAFRHGLIDAGVYLLDFDAYREHDEPFDTDALFDRAERFHQRIESVFAWAVTPEYLHELQAGRDGQA